MSQGGPDHILRRLELAQRRIERDLDAIAHEVGPMPVFSQAQSRLLQMIPPQGITATELAGHARITKQGLGQMVDILEGRGLVRRRRDLSDGRSRIITRTTEGNAAFDAINAWMNELHRHLEEELGAEAYAALWGALCALGSDEVDPYTDPKIQARANTGGPADNT